MSWFITNLVSALFLPPLNLLLIGLAGSALWHRRPRISRTLVCVSLGSLWLLSTPFVAEGALHLLEHETRPIDLQAQRADAIVILGGGTYFRAPEYANEDTVKDEVLTRLRYGARLYRSTGKPILVTGGRPLGNTASEAAQMKRVLEQDFSVPARWTEDASDNTLENARYTYQLLQQSGIRRIYLVTHAWHMPRSARAFRRAGFEVIEAPTAFTTRYQTDLLAFVPNAAALRDSKIFMHELIGLLWYRLKS